MAKKNKKNAGKSTRGRWGKWVFCILLTTAAGLWLYPEYRLYFAAGGISIVVCYVAGRLRRLRLASTMTAIDRMSGPEFERYLSRLFKKFGYRTKHVGLGGQDFGADLIVEKKGVRTAIQAKNYDSNRVGNDAVQQAIAGASYYDCSQALVVTNSMFTKAAWEQAQGSNIKVMLWDRRALENILRGKRP